MRQIGTLPDRAQASRLAAYLITKDISCEADEEDDGRWSIWVHNEQQIDSAREKLKLFMANPDAPEYQGREAEADKLLRREQQRREAMQRNTVEVRTSRWAQPPGSSGPFVTTLIALSVVASLLSGFGKGGAPGSLKDGIAEHLAFVTSSDYYDNGKDPLANIKKGQIWRAVTPIFPHLDLLHLLFNMYWLFQLGRLLETKMGAPRLAFMVLVIAIVSNSAQAMTPESMQKVMGGPFFFGMSGVVYGLFGYAWLRSQSDPTAGYVIPPVMVFVMLGWLVLCMTSFQNVANTAHVGGLITGMAIAQFG